MKIPANTKFGRLTVLKEHPTRSKDKHLMVECKCDCGTTTIKMWSRLKHGRVLSCGCLSFENKPNLSHGMRYTRTYESWASAKNRCTCKTSKDYPKYGGAGITFCNRWADSFEQFYTDMGDRPQNTSLDRIDTTKGYEPDNCRWATRSEQQRNKKKSYDWNINGEIFTSAEAAAIRFGVTVQTIHKWMWGWEDKRRNKKWSPKNGCTRIPKY